MNIVFAEPQVHDKTMCRLIKAIILNTRAHAWTSELPTFWRVEATVLLFHDRRISGCIKVKKKIAVSPQSNALLFCKPFTLLMRLSILFKIFAKAVIDIAISKGFTCQNCPTLEFFTDLQSADHFSVLALSLESLGRARNWNGQTEMSWSIALRWFLSISVALEWNKCF